MINSRAAIFKHIGLTETGIEGLGLYKEVRFFHSQFQQCAWIWCKWWNGRHSGGIPTRGSNPLIRRQTKIYGRGVGSNPTLHTIFKHIAKCTNSFLDTLGSVFEYGKVRNLSLNGRRVTDPKTLQGTNCGGKIPPMLNLTVWKDRHHIWAYSKTPKLTIKVRNKIVSKPANGVRSARVG